MRKTGKQALSGIHAAREKLENPYAFLNDSGTLDHGNAIRERAPRLLANDSELHAARKRQENQYAYLPEVEKLAKLRQLLATPIDETSISFRDIENKARALQGLVWHERHSLWPSAQPDPVSMLDPEAAARLLGIDFEISETLGEVHDEDGRFVIAGKLDRTANKISIAGQLKRKTHRFTAAHELGHWVLHAALVSHRDRPINSGAGDQRLPVEERQANRFASYYLMPRNLLLGLFRETFETADRFRFDAEAAHKLGLPLRQLPTELKDKAFFLAQAERFNGKHFDALHNVFRVSPSAMAIRLLELDLLG